MMHNLLVDANIDFHLTDKVANPFFRDKFPIFKLLHDTMNCNLVTGATMCKFRSLITM